MSRVGELRPALDVDDAHERVRDAYVAVVRAEKDEQAAAKTAEQRRSDAVRARLECGRELAAIRKQWPARGPKAKGWGEFLARAGIPERTAERLMELAGYVGEVSVPGENGTETSLPTRREIAEAKREDRTLAEREPATPSWLADLTDLIEGMQRDVKAAFFKAERVQQLCDEHEGAAVAEFSLLTTKSMLAGVRAVAADVLAKMGGIDGQP